MMEISDDYVRTNETVIVCRISVFYGHWQTKFMVRKTVDFLIIKDSNIGKIPKDHFISRIV